MVGFLVEEIRELIPHIDFLFNIEDLNLLTCSSYVHKPMMMRWWWLWMEDNEKYSVRCPCQGTWNIPLGCNKPFYVYVYLCSSASSPKVMSGGVTAAVLYSSTMAFYLDAGKKSSRAKPSLANNKAVGGQGSS